MRVGGFSDDFHMQAGVLNGCSDVWSGVRGTRCVCAHGIGTNSLPLDVAVDVDGIIEIDDYDQD